MMHRAYRKFMFFLAGLGACLALPAFAGETYTLGVVPQFEPRKLFATWKPIVDELQQRTGLTIRLAAALTVPEFENELEKGSFDFVYANPYHILRVRKSQGYLPLVRDAQPLRGILVIRRDSPIREVKELNGKTLAIPSANALGASLLIQADLERLYGVKMNLSNVRTHSSVYLNVINGLPMRAAAWKRPWASRNPWCATACGCSTPPVKCPPTRFRRTRGSSRWCASRSRPRCWPWLRRQPVATCSSMSRSRI